MTRDCGERLRAARRAAGFKTQRSACKHFGWNENTYRSHENGPRGIGKRAAIEYARTFGVSVTWLLTGVDDPREMPAKDQIETFAEEVERLKREIEERQIRLARLVLGEPAPDIFLKIWGNDGNQNGRGASVDAE